MAHRVIVHFGGNKTGSTALQAALHASREELLRKGILYPNLADLFPSNPNQHWPLAVSFQSEPAKYYMLSLYQYGSDQTRSLINAVRNRIEESLGNCEVLILSAEAFANLDEAELERFCAWLNERVPNVEGIFYARPPRFDGFYSMLQETVKGGHVPTALNVLNSIRFQQLQHAGKLNRVFSNMQFRVFEPNSLANGDIVEDFRIHAGLPELSRPDFQRRVNQRICPSCLALLYFFNKQTSVDQRKKFAVRRSIVSYDETYCDPVETANIEPNGWDEDIRNYCRIDWEPFLALAGANVHQTSRVPGPEASRKGELITSSTVLERWLREWMPDLPPYLNRLDATSAQLIRDCWPETR